MRQQVHVYCSHCSCFAILPAACVRDELAPLALHAYPEAYTDFKHMLLMLLDQRQQPSLQHAGNADGAPQAAPATTPTVCQEWSDAYRRELGDVVFHTMRQALGTT